MQGCNRSFLPMAEAALDVDTVGDLAFARDYLTKQSAAATSL